MGFHEAVGKRVPGQAGDVMNAQRIHEVLPMFLDGFYADAQQTGYLLGDVSFGDQLEDFGLATGQHGGRCGDGAAIEELSPALLQ